MKTPPSPRLVACPHCGAQAEWRPENRYRPFCSERCKLIDMGAWASNAYCVPGQDEPLSDDVSEQN